MGEGLLSPSHLLIILIIVLVVFGPKRLPELGRSLGTGMRDFRRSLSGEHDDEPKKPADGDADGQEKKLSPSASPQKPADGDADGREKKLSPSA